MTELIFQWALQMGFAVDPGALQLGLKEKGGLLCIVHKSEGVCPAWSGGAAIFRATSMGCGFHPPGHRLSVQPAHPCFRQQEEGRGKAEVCLS